MNKKIINEIINLTQKEIDQYISYNNFIIGIPTLLYLCPIFIDTDKNINNDFYISTNQKLNYYDLLLLEQIINYARHNENQIVSSLSTSTVKNYTKIHNCSFYFTNKNKTKIFNLFSSIEINNEIIKFVFSDIFKTLLIINKNAPKINLDDFNDEVEVGLILRHLMALRENNIKKINIEDIKDFFGIKLAGIENAVFISKISSSNLLKQLNIKLKDDFFIFGNYLSENQKTNNIKLITKHINKDKTLDFNLEFLKIATSKGYNIEEANTQFKNFKNHYYNNGVIKKDWLLAYDIWLDNHKKNNKENSKTQTTVEDQNLNTIFNMFFYGKSFKKDSIEEDIANRFMKEMDGLDLRDYYLYLNIEKKYFSENGYFKRNMIFISIDDYKNIKKQLLWDKYNYNEIYKHIIKYLTITFDKLAEEYTYEKILSLLKIEFLSGVTIDGKNIFDEIHLDILNCMDLHDLFNFYNQNNAKIFNDSFKDKMMFVLLYRCQKDTCM